MFDCCPYVCPLDGHGSSPSVSRGDCAMDLGFFPKQPPGLDSGARRMGKLGFLFHLATLNFKHQTLFYSQENAFVFALSFVAAFSICCHTHSPQINSFSELAAAPVRRVSSMTSVTYGFVVFATGLVIGSFITWRLTRT